MGQSLEIGLDGKTTVPEAVDKSKKAIKSFSEQIGDVKKKFGESFKDIFLSFLGPMALIGAAISLIAKMIGDYQQKQAEANKAAIDGTNELMSAEDRYWANKKEQIDKSKADTEQAKTQRSTTTEEFLSSDPRGLKIAAREGYAKASVLAKDVKIQQEVQTLLTEDMKKNPNNGIGKEFKAPEGFSNVVGVGANPVLEAMTAQLEEQRLQTQLLQVIASSTPAPSADFTKEPVNNTAGVFIP